MTAINLRICDPAPDLSLPEIDGRTHALADFADRSILVIIFSCNHCPYVQAYEDRLIAVQRDYADRGVHGSHFTSRPFSEPALRMKQRTSRKKVRKQG
ncbi:MAG: redoxin domain-containing protein [Nitrospiraceae bacterium]